MIKSITIDDNELFLFQREIIYKTNICSLYRIEMAAAFGSFHTSLKAVRAKTLPEEPSDGAKACQVRIATTKKTLYPILPSVVELPEKLST